MGSLIITLYGQDHIKPSISLTPAYYLDAKLKQNASWAWKGMSKLIDDFKSGIKWQIGERNISFYFDNWISS